MEIAPCMVRIEASACSPVLQTHAERRHEGEIGECSRGLCAGMMMELLVADQPAREPLTIRIGWSGPKDRRHGKPLSGCQALVDDTNHTAMNVNLDACIQCGLCVRAKCRSTM